MGYTIIFGGKTNEHEISIVSAISLKKILTNEVDNFIFLCANNNAFLMPTELMKNTTFTNGTYKKCKKISFVKGGFLVRSLFGTEQKIDCAINLIHGTTGEDGTLSGLLEFCDIPFIAPRVAASTLSFDKRYTKIYSESVGVRALGGEIFEKSAFDDGALPALDFPYIVKPARSGSSIGISIVKNMSEVSYALDCAFEHDTVLVIEPFMDGVKEYNIAGFKADGEFCLSIIEEPAKADFLSFEQKYLDFARDTNASEAVLPNDIKDSIIDAFKKIYGNVFDGAIIRCDIFVIDGKVYLNEINPIPGGLANYLFKNFADQLRKLSKSLPNVKKIQIDYNYLLKIKSLKGK